MIEQAPKRPVISVVIPLYNKEHEVTRAMQSVLAQTFTDFEVIVVNDGSTDKGPDIAKAISDSRVRIIDQANAGVSAARNKGIAEAQAELIAFLDADDEWESDFLETIIRLSTNFPACDAFATNYSFRRINNYKRSTILRGLPNEFDEGILSNYYEIASQSDPPLCSSAIAVTRRAIQSIGGFPIGVVAGEDLLTWARLAIRYDIAYTIEPKSFFWEPTNVSDRPGRIPDTDDQVGKELELQLQKCNHEKCSGLRNYIGLWHKNRASAYLRLGKKSLALKEILKSSKISGISFKLILYTVGTFLPLHITNALMEKIRNRTTKMTNGKLFV